MPKYTPDEEAREIIGATTASTVICGHTHMQFDRQIGDVRVVNAGSVGMPFGSTGAFWLLIDDEIHLQRTNYDLEQAAERVRGSDYPDAEGFASGNILTAPAEVDVLKFIMQIAAKQAASRSTISN